MTEPHIIAAERQRELRQRRAAWEAQRKQQREQREREEKQIALEAHLRQRGEAWVETTGTTPTHEELGRWRREYMDRKQAEAEADRAGKIAAAERHYDF